MMPRACGPKRTPGVISRAIAKRYRRTQTRQQQSRLLSKLKSEYKVKVLQEKRARHQLVALETQIRQLHKSLNNRGKLDFTGLFASTDATETRDDDELVGDVSYPCYSVFHYSPSFTLYSIYCVVKL
jgi:hypothetical protein